MVHTEVLGEIGKDFDDLKVRDPSKYRQLEDKLRRFKNETGYAVASSPTYVRQAERMR